ncbi:hypothetical protein NQ314_011064, partial [Rhamnusium bicolor]
YAQAEDNDETTDEPTTTTSTPVFYLELSDIVTQFTWSPNSNNILIIEADEGYKISVNITDCNIDGENGEYASITTDEFTNGLIFTYAVRNQPAYLYNAHSLLGNFVGTNASNFTAVFTRIGWEAHEYVNETLDSLIDSIARMAVDYCEAQIIPVNGTITLISCPSAWPNRETCAEVTFAVPVNLREDSSSKWGGYQLTTQHLEIMWETYYRTHLPEGITVYTVPDMGLFKWGIVIATAIVAVFVLSLFIIRYYGIKVSKMMRRRKLSDTASIISASDRNSQISLPPHYLQETPPLFENAYPMYNPEKSPAYAEPAYTKSFDSLIYARVKSESDIWHEVKAGYEPDSKNTRANSGYQDMNNELKEQSDEDDIEESGA